MATDSNIQVQPGELIQIVESVFANMLGLEVGACEAPWFPSANRLTAAVQLAGSWNGAVMLECDRRQACKFAGRYLSMNLPHGDLHDGGAPGPGDDVARDMLGELVNMIGGNLKCVLLPGIQLSMRSVAEGSDHRLPIGEAKAGERLAFQCVDGIIWITVQTMQS